MKDFLKWLYTGNGDITEIQWFVWIATALVLGVLFNWIF
jgi:hypothetical protein